MKYIYTLLFTICFTFSLTAQQVSVGFNGSELYYKTEANIYLVALKWTTLPLGKISMVNQDQN